MSGQRIVRYEKKPVCTKLTKEQIQQLGEIRDSFGINQATFIRKCIEEGLKNPAKIIKKMK